MATPQSVHSCHWSQPTLFLPFPLWFEAVHFEWSCLRGAQPRHIPDPHDCASCRGWTPVAAGKPCACRADQHLGCTAP